MRAALCTDGPAQMQAHAGAAVSKLAADDPWRPAALLVRGAADMLLGDRDSADAALAEAVERAATSGSTETRAIALGERSMLAAAREDVRTADALAEEAQRVIEEGELADYPTSALALAASARSRLRHGQWDLARRLLTAATRQTPHLTYALPWLAVQARIELADAYVTLRDREAAGHTLEEARGILAVRPDLGLLGEAVARLELELAAIPEARTGGDSGLTRAELRVLPLLSTHLSFREIGERLHVSRNTIKTQAISVYRKLGVSSRSEAVTVAEDLGLVEAVEVKEDRLELGETVGSLAL
jgi:LuxR family maltose regulon positive regulatory protein